MIKTRKIFKLWNLTGLNDITNCDVQADATTCTDCAAANFRSVDGKTCGTACGVGEYDSGVVGNN